MQCLQLTRGEPPATTVDVVLSGTLGSSDCAVYVDDVRYKTAGTVLNAKKIKVDNTVRLPLTEKLSARQEQ